jgi:U3 small nucleolar RNA-associated protein 20
LTFDALTPLFKDSKDYIRTFAAESFGFVLRKIDASIRRKVYSHILSKLRLSPVSDFCDGLSLLFFESIKHVKGNMHSKAPMMIQTLMTMIIKESENYHGNTNIIIIL